MDARQERRGHLRAELAAPEPARTISASERAFMCLNRSVSESCSHCPTGPPGAAKDR
ncbi:hypothetical protein [Actinomadura macrotermitis]|uniref:hypothetical protein n=1 Tax=Actinomadura macrotermitis TaxID=2585200 RepID=UPI0012969529|nr:hypothetical protein [Actinomadura macrotermitis]